MNAAGGTKIIWSSSPSLAGGTTTTPACWTIEVVAVLTLHVVGNIGTIAWLLVSFLLFFLSRISVKKPYPWFPRLVVGTLLSDGISTSSGRTNGRSTA